MSNNLFSHKREAVRVKVKKCETNVPPEWRKFSVDPQITSLEVLYSLLAKAFEIKSDFSIKFKAFDPAGNEIYLPVLSDWDLDAAFLRIHNLSIQTATEPCLILQIDIKPFTEVKEWEPETPTTTTTAVTAAAVGGGSTFTTTGAREIMSPLQQSFGVSQKYVQHMQNKLPGLIMNQMEKTFSMVQKAFNLNDEAMVSLPPRIPLSDAEFRPFLDALGKIHRSDDLRKVIFFGGIDPSLRRVVWKHILNVYPCGMNGHQRMEFMRRKAEHYHRLRDVWKNAVKQGCVAGELAYVTSMVKKDVLRTDRHHPFYAGSDDNQNIASLFNILTTYALNHPSVSYCQGMSDIASPLLVTMNDEAQAYICFCAIMARVKSNFMLDGIAMTQKFTHLTEALSYYDPVFWEYLKSQQADDLLFCYRWLLLELKREFPFDDALRMLEVQWSSLKYEANGDRELSLYEKEFVPIMETSAPTTSSSVASSSIDAQPTSPSYLMVKPRENAYAKICALRRQSSTASLSSLSSSFGASTNAGGSTRLDTTRRLNQSLDDNISRHSARRRGRASSKAHQSLDESKMLMLIESLEGGGANGGVSNKDSEAGLDDDDEVFASTPPAVLQRNHFDFLPTNPFKDDAIVPEGASDPSSLKTEVNNRAFLLSSSSASSMADGQDGGAVKSAQTLAKGLAKGRHSPAVTKPPANSNGAGSGGGDGNKRSGGHFKDLKEKLAASSRLGSSFDDGEKGQQKLVKNFNEFLNFASVNKSRIADKLTTTVYPNAPKIYDRNKARKSPSPTQTITMAPPPPPPPPLVQLTKSGFASSLDDSEDSSSVPDTTWSGSTAATAIQQLNNVSSHSLHLDLNSLASSTLVTPDRTPTLERRTPGDAESRKMSIEAANVTPDDGQDQEYYPMTTAITRELRLEAENLDRQVFGDIMQAKMVDTSYDIEYEKLDKESLDLVDDLKEDEIIKCPDVSELLLRRRNRDAKVKSSIEPLQRTSDNPNSKAWPGLTMFDYAENDLAKSSSAGDDFQLNPFIDDNLLMETSLPMYVPGLPNSSSLPEVLVPISADTRADGAPDELGTSASDDMAFASRSPQRHRLDINGLGSGSGSGGSGQQSLSSVEAETEAEAATATTVSNRDGGSLPGALPPPHEFGGGNPFLMFLCLTLLLQHRNTIIKSNMDYNEIAMHFDKMVRKHNVARVLNQARRMYIDYLKTQSAYKRNLAAQLNNGDDTKDSGKDDDTGSVLGNNDIRGT